MAPQIRGATWPPPRRWPPFARQSKACYRRQRRSTLLQEEVMPPCRSLSITSLPGLLWLCSCAGSPAVVDSTDAHGDSVRIDNNEIEVEAVEGRSIDARMAAYAAATQQQDSTTIPAFARVPAAIETAVEVREDDADELDEEVDHSSLGARMAAFLNLPEESRFVTAAGDMLSENAPGTPAFDPFKERDCPPEGSAKSKKNQNQNKLKNRARKPHAADLDDTVTFEALRQPGDDRDRWSTANAATIVCYVKKVQATGAETCNCGAKDKALTDTHFDLVADPSDAGLPVIAEITPVWRLIHKHFGQEDWSSAAIRNKYQGQKVRITGWLFFDEIHEHEANNTDPDDSVGKKNWRATAWEIHPITKIELVH